MRRKGIILIGLAVMLCAGFFACQRVVKPDTPANAAWLIKNAIDEGDYQQFQSLFTETQRDAVSAKTFQEMGEIITATTEYAQYEVLRFDNGEMLLIRLAQEKEKGTYKIEDVMVITDDMKALFE